jgi:hypothetical protein
MDTDVSAHTSGDKMLFHKFMGNAYVLLHRQLDGQGKLNLAGKLRVLGLVRPLDGVPQDGAVCVLPRRVAGQQYFRMCNAALFREVMRLAVKVILDFFPRPVT